MLHTEYDVIVVGVGSMGSAATYHLAKSGINVLGIDQADIPNTQSSHHGETRIIRFSYDEGVHYVDPVLQARDLWLTLEQESNTKIFHPIGGVYIAGPKCARFVDDPIDIAQEYGFKHEVLSRDEICTRFPAFDLPDGYRAFYEHTSGYLVPERAIEAHVKIAKENGAHILPNTKVTSIEPNDNGVTVITDKQSYTAQKVIVSNGAWMTRLMPELSDYITVTRNIICWFKPKVTDPFHKENLPIFTISDTSGECYGFPIHDTPGIKIGYHDETTETTADGIDRTVTQKDKDFIRHYAEKYFDLKDTEIIESSICLYSVTPDHDFIIGAHPHNENIILAGGFSGHGFKFSSVVGEILKDLANTGQSEFDLNPFSPARFIK